MANAKGRNKVTSYKIQSAKGTAASGGSGQKLRRRTSVFRKPVETYENDEIVSHRQSTGVSFGPASPAGRIDGLLSPGTYKDQFAQLLMRDFAAISDITGMTIAIAASGSNFTVTRSAGSFLTAGVKIGMVARLTAGSFNAANLNKNLLVIGVTATVLTVKVVNGVAMVAESGIASATLSIPGKSTHVPVTGHTDTWYTWEEWYNDISRSETYPDSKVAKIDVNVPATGNCTIGIDIVALDRVLGASQVLTSPSAETTTDVCQAVCGAVVVNGSATSSVTAFSASIDGMITHADATVGTNARDDVNEGDVKITGSFAAKFTDATLQTIKDDATTTALVVCIAEDKSADANFVSLIIPLVKLPSDDPDDGKKTIIRTYNYVAQYNAAGGSGIATEQTIFQIQDSAA